MQTKKKKKKYFHQFLVVVGILKFYCSNSLIIWYDVNQLCQLCCCRPKLKQLLEKRIGKENFFEKLSIVSKHELYSLASRRPKPSASTPSTLLFDYEFTRLVREIEGILLTSLLFPINFFP